MRRNILRDIWSKGGAAVNGWLAVPSPFSAETMAHQGWDSLTVDMQHGVIDYQRAVDMFTAISTTPTVPVARVPWLDPGALMKALGGGAYAVICPMVNTAEDAENLVNWTHYPPRGTRSFGPIRGLLYGGADYPEHANDTVVAFAMIETQAGLDNLDEILRVPGLDAVYVGPSDLSLALGCRPTFDAVDKPVAEAIRYIVAKAREHGKVAGCHNGSAEYALKRIEMGFQFVTVSSDARLLASGSQSILDRHACGPVPRHFLTERTDLHMSELGFIGLGIMGAPMAANLIAAGHTLYLQSRSGVPQPLIDAGGTACATHREVAERADIVFLMLPDTPHVEDVLFTTDGVAAGLSAGKTVVDMSSISPIETRDFAARITDLGCGYVDAPVSGGEIGAKAGTLTIMCGGSEADFEAVKPYFEIMGQNITLVGDVGAGQTCKVANQIIVALNIEAVSEALLFASKAGADPARVRQALMGGFAASKVLEVHGERMIKRTFEPGFRIELHQKDLNLALSNARAMGVSLPNTATAQELFNACAANGGAAWDHSAMVRALELMAAGTVA